MVCDDSDAFAERIVAAIHHAMGPAVAVRRLSVGALGGVEQEGRVPDLVVTDLRMPGRDGLSILVEFKARFPTTEVILCTAYPTIDTAIDALRLGAVDYVRKSGESWLSAVVDSAERALSVRPSLRAPGFHREQLLGLLMQAAGVSPVQSAPARAVELPPGLATELVVKLLLDSCEAFSETWHRWRSDGEEHDIVCLGGGGGNGFWTRQGSIVLVECKERSRKAGPGDRAHFEQKMRARGGQATVGIFVSLTGFTREFRRPKMPTPLPGGTLPVVVTLDRADLKAWHHARDRFDWLTRRCVESVLT